MKMIDVEKTVGDFHMNISQMEIQEGLIHGLIGANGCGKTTLAKLLMGLIKPDKGTIDLGDLNPRDITMTSQRPYLIHSSVFDNLVYPLKIRNANRYSSC